MSSSNIDLLLEQLQEIENRRHASKRLRTSSQWTQELNKKFIKCIKSQVFSDKFTLNNTQDIDWELVSEQMDRSVAKCKRHWFKTIRFQLINAENDSTSDCWHQLYDSARLICYIRLNNYDNEEDIDWDFLKEKFANIATYNKLLRIWRNLKALVPESDTKSFKQTIDWLWKNKMPNEVILSDDED